MPLCCQNIQYVHTETHWHSYRQEHTQTHTHWSLLRTETPPSCKNYICDLKVNDSEMWWTRKHATHPHQSGFHPVSEWAWEGGWEPCPPSSSLSVAWVLPFSPRYLPCPFKHMQLPFSLQLFHLPVKPSHSFACYDFNEMVIIIARGSTLLHYYPCTMELSNWVMTIATVLTSWFSIRIGFSLFDDVLKGFHYQNCFLLRRSVPGSIAWSLRPQVVLLGCLSWSLCLDMGGLLHRFWCWGAWLWNWPLAIWNLWNLWKKKQEFTENHLG